MKKVLPTEGAKPHFSAGADVRWLPVMLAKHILEVRGHVYGRFSFEGRISLSSRGRAFFTLCSARDDLRSVPCAGLEHCQAAPMRPMRRCALELRLSAGLSEFCSRPLASLQAAFWLHCSRLLQIAQPLKCGYSD